MPSEATNQATRTEWKELGFFYARDDGKNEWRLIGSRSGLAKFSDLLRSYVREPRNEAQSEHEHYGPYMYLNVMTWPDAGFDRNAIRGRLDDLARLASLIDSRLKEATPGSCVVLRDEFAKDSEYSLVLEVRGDDFSPASADLQLPSEAS